MADPITHPQTVRLCNELVRPAADRLFALFGFSDLFALRMLAPEVLEATGMTLGMIVAPEMPSVQDYPDAVIEDGAAQDGRPPMTRRRLLAVLRVVLQFREQTVAEVYGVPAYVRQVAAAVAVHTG